MGSKLLFTRSVVPGMVLAGSLVSPTGQFLLKKNTVLTKHHIEKLQAWNIRQVMIDDEIVYGSSNTIYMSREKTRFTSSPAPAKTKFQDDDAKMAKKSGENSDYIRFLHQYDSLVTNVARLFADMRSSKKIPVPDFKTVVSTICRDMKQADTGLTLLLKEHSQTADTLSQHSVMSAFFSNMLARWLDLSQPEIESVTLAGLLHDIGKIDIAVPLIDNQQKYRDKTDNYLSSEAHLFRGASLINNTKQLPLEIASVALQHHECIDGSGPLGLTDKQLHLHAKIVGLASRFHSEAYSGNQVNPFPVLDGFNREMFTRLDPWLCQVFANRVKDMLLNTKVRLTDGRSGDIICYKHGSPVNTPIVRFANGKIVDLSGSMLSVNNICAINRSDYN